MKSLAKLDLDPNTVYNVSLSVSQGNKKFDNLRFFQTKTPKLFNIVPGQYSTYSRVTTALEPVVPVIGGGKYDDADLITTDLTKLEWDVNWKYDTSEGETSYNLGGSTVTVQATFGAGYDKNNVKAKQAGIPTFAYEIKGFETPFGCLNGRSDWKRVSNTVFSITIPVTEFDPGITANPHWYEGDTGTENLKDSFYPSGLPKGSNVIYLSNKPTGAVPGKSTVKLTYTGAGKVRQALPVNTKVIYVQRVSSPYYITVSQPTIVAAPKTANVSFSNYKWTKGLAWSSAILNPDDAGADNATHGELDGSHSTINLAKGQYYDAPSYSPITTTYSFTGTSTVNTELLNATVLDSLIWEETMRDFVYFFVTDSAPQTANRSWYYFNNAGGITPATLTSGISGTALSIYSGTGEDRVLNAPPSAPSYVTDVNGFPSYPAAALRAKAKFYDIHKTNAVNDATPPNLVHPIGVRFAIARYTKTASGSWSGYWLSSGSDKTIKNVLSLEEGLGG